MRNLKSTHFLMMLSSQMKSRGELRRIETFPIEKMIRLRSREKRKTKRKSQKQK
jgi:hypothetical protein